MVEVMFPAPLRQDSRYYRMPNGGFVNRTIYAVSRMLVTRSDAGAGRFNFISGDIRQKFSLPWLSGNRKQNGGS